MMHEETREVALEMMEKPSIGAIKQGIGRLLTNVEKTPVVIPLFTQACRR
ncbi:hypothetical protein BDL97_17G064300 [Sphagnum fallax]|nr:hypothetical protein BDL97_17G064300 [Sphagnum fallax]